MKNIRISLSENCHFLVIKFSVYLYRHVFVMENKDLIKLGLVQFGVLCPFQHYLNYIEMINYSERFCAIKW